MEIKIVFRGCVPLIQWMGNNVRYVLHILITMHLTKVTQLLGTGLSGDKSKSTCGHRILGSWLTTQ